jgi:hypothetical protein
MGSAIGRGLIRHNAPDAIHSQQVTQREVEAVDDDPSLPHRPLKRHRWSGQAGTAVDTDGYSSISEYSNDHFDHHFVPEREFEAVDDDPSLPHRPLKKHRWSEQEGTAVDTDGYSSTSEYSSDHFDHPFVPDTGPTPPLSPGHSQASK